MEIVTASDAGYVPLICVLFSSCARHNPDASFTILALNWGKDQYAMIDRLATYLSKDIEVIDVDPSELADIRDSSRNLRPANFLKVLVPEKVSVEKAIYMDCDMVVMGSLSDLWEQPFSQGSILKAVPCQTPSQRQCENIGVRVGEYFNSGLMVIDCSEWRRLGASQEIISRCAADNAIYLSQEEDTINHLYLERTDLLGSEYNTYAVSGILQTAFKSPNRPIVLHFLGKRKPWFGLGDPLHRIWHFEENLLEPVLGNRGHKVSFLGYASYLNRCRKGYIGEVLGKPKYTGFRQHIAWVRQIVKDYLQREGA